MSLTPTSSVLRHAAAAILAVSAALVTACGGGGDAAAPTATTERATAYVAGPITGFGSVIVNGVRFDDSAASVTDDDDRARSRDMLRLGMMVEVDGADLDAAAASGRALRIRLGSEIVGPVDARTDSSLSVLGQTVDILETTVFDSDLVGGMAAIAVGDVLEVHAQFDASTGRYRATRIEREADATTYKLRGVVADLSATGFTLGGQVINYAAIPAADLPANLANGMRVRVRLQTTKNSAGEWVATSVRAGVRKVDDRDEAEVRGTVTALRSAIDFDVNGQKVNAAQARFPDGTAGVVLGAMVEVKGAMVDGVLVANEVELEDHHASDWHLFELHGVVSELDATAKTFLVRGVRVSYGSAITWKNGDASKLANGVAVEVKGTPSADRTQLEAQLIEFEG